MGRIPILYRPDLVLEVALMLAMGLVSAHPDNTFMEDNQNNLLDNHRQVEELDWGK